MSKALRIAWLSPFVIAFIGTLAGCGTTTMTANPNTFAVRGTTQTLRAPQTITLKNGYSSETKMIMRSVGGMIWDADMRQLTDVAIEMMSRHLAKNGINVGSGEKTVTVSVRDVRADIIPIPFATRYQTVLGLEARLGDGTVSTIPAQNSSPGGPDRSIDGALLFAVTGLLNDAGFVGYVNR